MTEKTFNYTLKYYLFQMGRLKTLTAFSCIFGVLGFPLLIVAQLLSQYSSDYDNISVPMLAISIISIFIVAALSFITPLVACKHLYTKTSADNILSLPLTTTQRFIGDIGAILTSYSLPFIISVGLAYISEYATMSAVNKNYDANYREMVLFAFFATLEFMALNTAIITCCGRLAEAILYPFAVNIVMPLAVTYGGEIAFVHAFGMSSGDITATLQSPVYNMWPLGFLLNISNYTGAILWAAIFSAVYFALAYLGYRKRRAESIGKPFVFKYSYLVTTVVIGISFIISYIRLSDMGYMYYESYFPQYGTLVAVVVILLIMMLIMELVNYKKIHSIPKFALHYAGTLGGGILICLLLIWSKGFGLGYYVPAASQVETVNLYGYYREADWKNGVDNNIYVRSEEAINLVREEHQYVIDTADEHYDPYDSLSDGNGMTIFNLSLNYRMKNGTLMNRNYSTNAANHDLWEKLFSTEDYRVTPIANIQYHDYFLDEPAEIRLVNRHSQKVYIDYLQENVLESELLKALEADLRADTEYGRHDENSVGVLLIGRANKVSEGKYATHTTSFLGVVRVPIYESYVNTINVFSQHGTVPTAEEATEDSVKNCEIFMLTRMPTGGIDMAAETIYGRADSSAIFITAEEFKELTSKQVKYNIFDGEDTSDDYEYTLIRGGWSYLDQINHRDIMIEALEKDGFVLDSYDFFEDYTSDIFGSWHIDDAINTEYNAYCDQLFESRTKLVYTETETAASIYLEE